MSYPNNLPVLGGILIMDQSSKINTINIKIEPDDSVQNETQHLQMETEIKIKREPEEFTENTPEPVTMEYEVVQIKCEPTVEIPVYLDNVRTDNIGNDYRLNSNNTEHSAEKSTDNVGHYDSFNSNDTQESMESIQDETSRSEAIEIEVDVQHIVEENDCNASSSKFTKKDRQQLMKKAYKIHDTLKSNKSSQVSTKTYECDQCNMVFIKKNSWSKHLVTHLGLKYDCEICHKQFSSKHNMIRHKNTHTGVKPYSCDHCAKSFMEKSYLAAHLRTHFADKIYKCPVCVKEFRERTHLIRHERIHSGERPYSCEICHKTFKQSAHLSCHRKIHKKKEVLYCDMCQQGFLTKEDLYEHHKVHIGEKAYAHSFVCEVCHREFSQSSHLNDHVRIHNGNRPYDCPICNKPFSQRSTLNRHIKTHSGAKPFSCPVCKKKFKQKTHVVKHIKIHERDGEITASFPLVVNLKPDPIEEDELDKLYQEEILSVECNPDLAIKPNLVQKTPNFNVENSITEFANETVFIPNIKATKDPPLIVKCEPDLTERNPSISNAMPESTVDQVYISIKTEVLDPE